MRLDAPGVDAEHAKVSEVAVIAIGKDVAVGDVPLDPGMRRLISAGDEIQIGTVMISLEEEGEAVDDDENTAPGLGPPMLYHPRVRVVEGANFGEELVLSEQGRPYKIGRTPGCDMALDDREVSREHLTLTWLGQSVFVQDIGSTRGSWLGRAAVYTSCSMEWVAPRMLRIGASVLSLVVPHTLRKRPAYDREPSPPSGTELTKPWLAIESILPPSFDSAAPAEAKADSPDSAMHPSPSSPATEGAGVDSPELPSERPRTACPRTACPRTAWKGTGLALGKGRAALLLVVAGVVVLVALFVLFGVME